MDVRSPGVAEPMRWTGLPALHGIAGACVDCAKMGNQPALLLLSICRRPALCVWELRGETEQPLLDSLAREQLTWIEIRPHALPFPRRSQNVATKLQSKSV